MVAGESIPAELPLLWVREQTRGQRIIAGAADNFRFAYLRRASEAILNMPGEARKASNKYGEEPGRVYFTRPSDLTKAAPDITSGLGNQKFYCGDSMIMRWYLNNVKRTVDGHGNVAFEKIEAKTRKTDGAMALFAGMTLAPLLEKYDKKPTGGIILPREKNYR